MQFIVKMSLKIRIRKTYLKVRAHFRWFCILPLVFYKKYISSNRCLYTPTCSIYSMQAILRFGILKGGVLTVWRLLRCNPFSKGGYDPVPDKLTGDYKWVL